MVQANLVFGYGSLTDVENLQKYLKRNLVFGSDYIFCGLKGFRRCWNVAMNNSIDLPNYKYYIDRQTKHRPAGFVTFLNLRPCQDNTVVGILFYVFPQELRTLDLRERNYRRIVVTNSLDRSITGTAYSC